MMKLITQSQLKSRPSFKAGDSLKVHTKVVEGESERIQVFEGTVIRRHGTGISETFTVRKVSFGVGIERTFPLHSPRVDKIEVVKVGKVRRSRLYFLRNLSGKAARLQEEGAETAPKAVKAPEERGAAPAPKSHETKALAPQS